MYTDIKFQMKSGMVFLEIRLASNIIYSGVVKWSQENLYFVMVCSAD